MKVLSRVVATTDDWGATVARLALATVMFAHGAQKAFGLWGGFGLEGTLGFFQSIGVPVAAAWLVIAAEVLGSVGLAVGLLGRVAAAGMIPVLAGAVYLVHWANGFYMNWGGNQKGEGFELHLLAIALALVVVIRGSGALSLDRLLSPRDAGSSPRLHPVDELATVNG